MGIMGGLLTLISMYYVFDLDYPTVYQHFLGILQTFVMEEPYKKKSSKGFKVVCKNLKPKMEELKRSGEENIGSA